MGENNDYLSILNVLEGFFNEKPDEDRIQHLSRNEVEALRERVLEFSAAEEDSPPSGAIYPGSWVAGNWHLKAMRSDLNQNLLYHQAMVTQDPLADFFGVRSRWHLELHPIRYVNGATKLPTGPRQWNKQLSYEEIRDDLDEVRNFLSLVVPYIFDLSPLLRAGIILPRPQWKILQKRRNEMETSVRHDAKNQEMLQGTPKISQEIGPLPVWDNILGMHVSLNQDAILSDQRWEWQYEFLQLAKQIAFADYHTTTYIPQSTAEMELLRLKVGQLSRSQDINPEPAVLSEITRFSIPDLSLSTRTAVAIRENEEDFEAWRRTIRKISRESKNDSPQNLHQRVEDELKPICKSIEKFSNSRSIKQHINQDGISAVLTGGGASFTAGLMGMGVPEVVLPGAVGGILSWVWKMYHRPKLQGEARILSFLQR